MQDYMNMTPHEVTILDADNNVIRRIPASGKLIRLQSKTVSTGHYNDVPLTKTEFGDPEGLPERQVPGTYYIVSQLVKSACTSRHDLLVPAEVVRNESGNIIGCRSLGQ